MNHFKKIILLIAFPFLCNLLIAQTNVSLMEYWFDNDFVSKQPVAVSSSKTVNILESISTSSLSQGLHTINMRAKDDTGNWSVVHSQSFYKNKVLSENTSITQLEYWIDGNYSQKQSRTTAGSQDYILLDNLDLSTVTTGLHILNIRAKDNLDRWSVVHSQFFYKHSDYSEGKKIVQLEYWTDNQYAEKITSDVSGSEIFTMLNELKLTNVSQGLHTLNIRAKDNSSAWSIVHSQSFFKHPDFSNGKQIIAYEYWIDNQFDNRIELENDASSIVFLPKELSLSDLPVGLHTLNIRAKDNSSTWSVVHSQTFYQNAAIQGENKISAYSYWFDSNLDESTLVLLENPANPYELQAMIDVPSELALGEHTFNIRFRDLTEKWSIAVVDTFTKTNVTYLPDIVANQVSVYPNPFETQLILVPGDLFGEINVELNDLQGKLIWSDKINIESNEIALQIPVLPKGVYVIKLKGKDKTVKIKVIKK